jgi:hypothetical protein
MGLEASKKRADDLIAEAKQQVSIHVWLFSTPDTKKSMPRVTASLVHNVHFASEIHILHVYLSFSWATWFFVCA